MHSVESILYFESTVVFRVSMVNYRSNFFAYSSIDDDSTNCVLDVREHRLHDWVLGLQLDPHSENTRIDIAQRCGRRQIFSELYFQFPSLGFQFKMF